MDEVILSDVISRSPGVLTLLSLCDEEPGKGWFVTGRVVAVLAVKANG